MATEDTGSRQLSGLEKFYVDNFVIAIILSVCCNGLFLIPLILSAITFFTAKDPKAKNNAMICMIISIVLVGIGIVMNFLGVMGNLANR